MTGSSDLPIVTQNLRNDEAEALLTWLEAMIVDLRDRADVLHRLVYARHDWRSDPRDRSADRDDAAATMTIRVDRDAWQSALETVSRPRPTFPVSAPSQR